MCALSYTDRGVDALQAIGFVAFRGAKSGSQLAASLADVTAVVHHRFLQQVADTQWDPIANRLSILADSSSAICVRDADGNIDIVIFKNPRKSIPGKTWAESEENYIEYVRNTLESIAAATRSFVLTPQSRKLINDAYTAAVSVAGVAAPHKKVLDTAVSLLTVLAEFRGRFRVIVVTTAGGLTEDHRTGWGQQGQYSHSDHVYVEGWLYETVKNQIHGTARWVGAHWRPSQLNKPGDLMTLINNRYA